MRKTILLTGAGGFLGTHLAEHLASIGMDVIPVFRAAVCKVGSGRWEADLTRPDHILQLREAEVIPDVVIHLAGHIEIALEPDPVSASMPPVPGKENIHELYNSNIMTTANILDYCLHKGVRHIIYASSQTVYGMPAATKITEEFPCVPLDHYASSKLCGEHLLKVGTKQGVSVTALRFPGLYGEKRSSGVVYNFCRSALAKKEIRVDAAMPLPFDVIHVDDVAAAIGKAAGFHGNGWMCLNVATGEPCNLNLLADAVAELVPGCGLKYSAIPQPVVCMDSSKADAVLGWKALPRRERLTAMIDFLSRR